MAIYRNSWTVYSRTRKHNATKASAYTSRSAWGGERAGTKERPYSAVAAAAYVSRSKTWDSRYAKSQDYSRKRDLAWSGILAPKSAPAWVYDRQKLWTAVEEREDQSNRKATAQLFRGAVISLPRELTLEQNVKLITDYVRNEYVSHGMIADICIHNPSASDGGDQPHAHIMLTMRDIGPNGFGLKRRDWNEVDFGNQADGQKHRAKAMKDGILHQNRKSWAEYVNRALEDAGIEGRVDHRSHRDRETQHLPSVTMGKAQHASDEYEFVRKKKAKQADTRRFNAGIDLGMVSRVVMGAIEGGPEGLALVAMGEMAPHLVKGLEAIPHVITSWMENHGDKAR